MELQVGAFCLISGAETKLTDLMRTTLRIEINESRQGGARLSHRWFWIIHEHSERLYSRMIRSYCNDGEKVIAVATEQGDVEQEALIWHGGLPILILLQV